MRHIRIVQRRKIRGRRDVVGVILKKVLVNLCLIFLKQNLSVLI